MKKKLLLFIVLIMFLLGFSGYKYVKFQYDSQNLSNITSALISVEDVDEKNINNLIFKSNISEKIDTVFFSTIFKKENLGISFEKAEDFIRSTEYEYLAEKAAENNISTIKVYERPNKQGDRITFIFMYNNKLEIETLKSIFYLIPEENKEVLVENLSDDNKEYYTQYKAHMLEKEYTKANNIQSLSKFLFNYEEINKTNLPKIIKS